MKRSVRFYLTGSMQKTFFPQFIKEQADKLNVRGYVRHLEDGRAEIFLEGDNVVVQEMSEICKKNSKHSVIRSFEEKEEHFQDFKDFKVLRI